MATTKSSKTSKKKPAAKSGNKTAAQKKPPVRRLVWAIVFLFFSVITFLGLFSSEGVFVNWICRLFKGLVGNGFSLVPFVLLACALILFFHHGRPVLARTLCAFFIPSAYGALAQLFAGRDYELNFSIFKSLWLDGCENVGGGAFSGVIAEVFEKLFSRTGAAIIVVVLLILMLLVIFLRQIKLLRRWFAQRERYVPEPEPEFKERPAKPSKTFAAPPPPEPRKNIDIPVDDETPAPALPFTRKKSFFNRTPSVITPEEAITGKKPEEPEIPAAPPEPEEVSPAPVMPVAPIVSAPADETAPEIPNAPAAEAPPEPAKAPEDESFDAPPENEAPHKNYKFPPLTLLASDTSGAAADASEETELNKQRLEAALQSFGINSSISAITRGPTVTRYEIELEAGVKLSRLTGLADDLALSLGAAGVRIAAIPNKISTVGIEVPNKTISSVYLRDIIDSPAFQNAESKLTFAIGKNISGDAIVGNISKLPHMLVAGTTGSGKSVCLNSMILSILYKATPDEVKFIMIDPKMVEFKVYNGIPHMLVPVVTEAKKAAGALQWAVTEMMKRYRLFSESGARDIASYNEYCNESEDDDLRPIPHIVVVIDELADLMLVASKEVEEAICRVAQMGRAAGVHLIIATQSPRADVITGLMKANIPSRIALKVSSALESRIILDAGGAADKLVGNGDMLYAPIGTSKPIRIQGTWVSDEERENIVKFVKESGEAEYAQDVIAQIEKAAEGKGSSKQEPEKAEPKSDYDELLPQAVDVVFELGQASVSLLQRRLKLGYSRAARIVDQMEEVGVVGPFEGSKPRQILITKQQWQEMQFINGTAPIQQPPADLPEAYPVGQPAPAENAAPGDGGDDLFN